MSDLDVLLPSFPSPVLTIAEDTSFLEVSIGDPRGVPLPSTMAVARTVSAQEHLAVQGSHHEETAGAERDLRKAGSPTSSTKSFMLHVTAYSRPLHGSEEKLGKSCCVCVFPHASALTSSWAQAHGQHRAAAPSMQCLCLHFPGPPEVTNNKPMNGGKAWRAGFAEHWEELLPVTCGTCTYPKGALGTCCAYGRWESRGSSVQCAAQGPGGTGILSCSPRSKLPKWSKGITVGDSSSPRATRSGGSGKAEGRVKKKHHGSTL